MKKLLPPPTAQELARQLQEFDAVMILPDKRPQCREQADTHEAQRRMKKKLTLTKSAIIRHGSLCLNPAIGGSVGDYTHPLGMVSVVHGNASFMIRTAHCGVKYWRSYMGNFTPRQVSNKCRKLLEDLHAPMGNE